MSEFKQSPPMQSQPNSILAIALAIVTFFLPGLGQLLTRKFRRGLLMLASFATIIALLVWRFVEAAPRDTGFIPIFLKGIRLEPMLLFILLLALVFMVLAAIDGYHLSRGIERNAAGLFILIAVLFFFLGWQLSGIDIVRFITGLDEGRYRLGQVMWPWSRAIYRPEELVRGDAIIEIPCSDDPPAQSEILPDEPYLIAEPTCGVLSVQQGPEGTELHLIGGNFIPNMDVDIMWEDPIGNQFRQRQGGEYISVMSDDQGGFEIDIIMPYRLLPTDVGEFQYWEVYGQQVASLGEAEASIELKLAITHMIETIFLGMMATCFGIVFSVPISFLAARNLMSASWVTIIIYFLVRGVLNIVRSIEPLIWAVIATIIVGLGPFAGILALTVHSIAALGKLYSEAIESIDPGPIEAIQATGANWLQTVIYGVVPQIIPPFVSFTIYRWDINVRMSTIIGMVGGGGIGFLLYQWIKLLDYRAAGIAVWFIAITVAVLDFVSAEIRKRFV
ncbi:MAG: phosphonate ABC transporter, permease protein PhnE [Anaerolineales bacterium]